MKGVHEGFGRVMFVYVQYVPVHVYMRKKLRQLLNKLLRQHIYVYAEQDILTEEAFFRCLNLIPIYMYPVPPSQHGSTGKGLAS